MNVETMDARETRHRKKVGSLGDWWCGLWFDTLAAGTPQARRGQAAASLHARWQLSAWSSMDDGTKRSAAMFKIDHGKIYRGRLTRAAAPPAPP
jgi:hypothetical protein